MFRIVLSPYTSVMRFYAVMPVRNEVRRYLRAHLLWHSWMFDGIAIFDDQSDDDSVQVAHTLGAKVMTRPSETPSFLEHEGQFRQTAWEWMEATCQPEEGDWVLAVDADEFLIGSESTVDVALYRAVVYAEKHDFDSVYLPIPEVFGSRNDQPFVRTDGFWGQLGAPRLVRYRADALFQDSAMGCGSIPTYVQEPSEKDFGLRLLHYGYATYADRVEKFQRYSAIRHNHNPDHIASILQPPTLEPWPYSAPPVSILPE